jgi:hypothetical protein
MHSNADIALAPAAFGLLVRAQRSPVWVGAMAAGAGWLMGLS